MTIEKSPIATPKLGVEPRPYIECETLRMLKYMSDFKGVVVRGSHSVAWDKQRVYDPSGKIYELPGIDTVRCFFAVSEIKSVRVFNVNKCSRLKRAKSPARRAR